MVMLTIYLLFGQSGIVKLEQRLCLQYFLKDKVNFKIGVCLKLLNMVTICIHVYSHIKLPIVMATIYTGFRLDATL